MPLPFRSQAVLRWPVDRPAVMEIAGKVPGGSKRFGVLQREQGRQKEGLRAPRRPLPNWPMGG